MEARHRLAPLLAPRSIAFVGASTKTGTPGNHMIVEARRGGFAGAIYPVNPKYDEVEGLACYRSLAELPEAVDLAVLSVANQRIEEQLAAAIDAGAGAALIYASCYLEGDGDPPLLERLRRRARAAGLPVCGGNCMGLYNFEANVWMSLWPLHDGIDPGPIAFISHSGSALGSMLDFGNRLTYNIAVSAGQEITTTAADYLDYALELPSTRVAGLFLEGVRDPQAFTAALEKAAARDVPVVALKVARTEKSARLALSHSGAIAGSDDAFQAMCERYGVLRADSFDELAATVALLAQPRRAGPGGLAAIIDSGGERELLVDLASDIGVPFAEIDEATTAKLAARLEYGLEPINPCDAWGTSHDYEGVFTDCFKALIADADTAIGVFFADIRTGRWLSHSYVRACLDAAATTEKPVAMATLLSWVRHDEVTRSFIDAEVPVLDGAVPALKAVRHAFDWRDFKARAPMTPPEPPAGDVVARWRARLASDGALDEAEGLALLSDFGVPTLPVRVVEDRDAALAAAAALGFPVAVKTAMPGIDHKSDVGGVVLGLADSAAVAAAYDDLATRLGPRVLVAPMAAEAIEIALGLTIDAQFGPLVMVGGGGVLVELLDDARFALPPFDVAHARAMIANLRVKRLLDGVRGKPPADIDALAQTLARFSVLASELGDVIGEIDVNPLMAGPAGCVAVDALVVARGEAAP
ncbi:MAG: acetate--CoA ligase family protein [Alphaproteobacteria bacterium]